MAAAATFSLHGEDIRGAEVLHDRGFVAARRGDLPGALALFDRRQSRSAELGALRPRCSWTGSRSACGPASTPKGGHWPRPPCGPGGGGVRSRRARGLPAGRPSLRAGRGPRGVGGMGAPSRHPFPGPAPPPLAAAGPVRRRAGGGRRRATGRGDGAPAAGGGRGPAPGGLGRRGGGGRGEGGGGAHRGGQVGGGRGGPGPVGPGRGPDAPVAPAPVPAVPVPPALGGRRRPGRRTGAARRTGGAVGLPGHSRLDRAAGGGRGAGPAR